MSDNPYAAPEPIENAVDEDARLLRYASGVVLAFAIVFFGLLTICGVLIIAD